MAGSLDSRAGVPRASRTIQAPRITHHKANPSKHIRYDSQNKFAAHDEHASRSTNQYSETEQARRDSARQARPMQERTEDLPRASHGRIITRTGREFADLTGDTITFAAIDEDKSRKLMGLPAKIRAHIDLTESGAVSSPRDTASGDGSGRLDSGPGLDSTQYPSPRSDARRGTDADTTTARRSRSPSPRASRPETPQYRIRDHAVRWTSPVSPKDRSVTTDLPHTAAMSRSRDGFEGFREVRWSATPGNAAAARPTTAPHRDVARLPQKPTQAHQALHLENLAHYCVRDRYNHQQNPSYPPPTFHQNDARPTNGALAVQAPWTPGESAVRQPSPTPFQKMLSEQRAVMRERLREKAVGSGPAEQQRSAIQQQQQPKSGQQFFEEQVALLLEVGRRQQ
ncbi:hypothetical protein CERZMDRAFT_83061 [Cercospora zeae-maydis SCOH1-5]|uniref:Uncharacterized protein n=1 Tax=Cercospora zeae-maydis SCOH1-5 TaxID=717836 RepID=A0A6A6FLK7_9PEZI|nr:hypothetical protein CERZMDRAFT_83061 [Cercospora zeae-maydis SCOH1-5]